MSLSKILVCTDLSEGSDVALTNAINIGQYTGASVVLLHVCEAPPMPVGLVAQADWDEVVRSGWTADRTRLGDVREHHAALGVDVSNLVVEGTPHEAIVAAADEIGADLIVVGTVGRTGFSRLPIGSVAERVLRAAHVSVMVARPGHAGGHGFRRILVPTDFSPGADAVLALAISLAADGASIDLLHCWQLPDTARSPWAAHRISEQLRKSLAREMRAAAQRRGEQLLQSAGGRARSVKLGFELVEASPKLGIQRWTTQSEYDLLVIGRGGLRSAPAELGAGAEATARHAECSVVVVR